MHPEAQPAARNLRKRALLITLMKVPPVVVVFDSGHGEVVMPSKHRHSHTQQVRLDCNVAFGPYALSVLADFEKDGLHTIEIPYAAIHRITSIQLEETFIYNLDAQIAQARHQLYTSPMRKMVN